MNLVNAAKRLGRDTLVMDSYYNFQKGKFHWFFSPNPKLNSATEKPKALSTWDHWYRLAPNQRRTLASLAGFREDATNIVKNDPDLGKLKAAYSKWRRDLYSVFWGNEKTGVWTCNIFVGDAIYLWKQQSVMGTNRHYFDPKQIKRGEGPFKKVEPKNAKPGTIVVFGELFTSI